MSDLVLAESSVQLSGLAQLAAEWHGRGDDGKRYHEALASFLATLGSDNSRRSFGYSINLFFRWYEKRHRVVPLPRKVMRLDAAEFAKWLELAGDEVIELQLRDDALGMQIYLAVRQRPGCRFEDIAKALQRVDLWHQERAQDLDRKLSALICCKVLTRTPTMAELRAEAERNGESIPGLEYRPDPSTYRYQIYERSVGASTIELRLKALSSFWQYLVDTAENTDDNEPLLQHNVWSRVLRQASKRARSSRRASRSLRTPDLELFVRVLTTTYIASHPEAPDQAAWAAVTGVPVEPTGRATLYDLRDRACLLLLFFTGLRIDELVNLRRSDLPEEGAPLLRVTGKGRRERVVLLPEPALWAVRDLQDALVPPADPRLSRRKRREPLTAMLESPDAPLVPPLKMWGKNAPARPESPHQIKGLSQSATTKMLQRRAERAGIKKDSQDYKRLHVHGLRHLAAQSALARGVPLPIVQAVLGHESLATTGLYLEQHDPKALTLWPTTSTDRDIKPDNQSAQVIDTTGEEQT
jgi:site-specific recombinase XerD